MKAAVYDRYGGPEVLVLREVPEPTPGPGEALVRVAAAAINPVDWKMMRGDLRWVTGRRFPRFIGADFAGTIAAVGPGFQSARVGEAVFGNINPIAGRRGGLAQHVLVRASEIAPKPETVSFADAATLPVAGLSAWDCLERLGQTKAGQRLLVLGAAGGVGSFVVQLGKLNGVHVTGVCREANAEWVRQLGADRVIAYDREPVLAGAVRYDCIIDAAAVSSFGACRGGLVRGGRYVNTMPTPRNYLDAWRTSLFGDKQARVLIVRINPPRLAQLAGLMAEGRLRSIVTERFTLANTVQALTRSTTGHVRGKIVVEP